MLLRVRFLTFKRSPFVLLREYSPLTPRVNMSCVFFILSYRLPVLSRLLIGVDIKINLINPCFFLSRNYRTISIRNDDLCRSFRGLITFKTTALEIKLRILTSHTLINILLTFVYATTTGKLSRIGPIASAFRLKDTLSSLLVVRLIYLR